MPPVDYTICRAKYCARWYYTADWLQRSIFGSPASDFLRSFGRRAGRCNIASLRSIRAKRGRRMKGGGKGRKNPGFFLGNGFSFSLSPFLNGQTFCRFAVSSSWIGRSDLPPTFDFMYSTGKSFHTRTRACIAAKCIMNPAPSYTLIATFMSFYSAFILFRACQRISLRVYLYFRRLMFNPSRSIWNIAFFRK